MTVNNSGHKTRLATVEDAHLLRDLGSTTFRDTFSTDNTSSNIEAYLRKNFTIDRVREELLDPSCIFILVYDGDRAVGYAKLIKSISADGQIVSVEIERLYSIKDYIGKSVGKTLMESCLNLAKGLGVDKVTLGVWERNPRAIAFYEKWGFQTVGSHPFVLGDDVQTDLVMVKKFK